MEPYLRVLHLEDEPDFSELVCSLLQQAGVNAEVVLSTNRAEFEGALAGQAFDIILADYALPDYDGLQALAYAREHCPATPFILVSGSIGEQAAIDSLKAGASDYVLKLWPERLAPAVLRAVQSARDRLERERAEEELARRERYFRALTENSLDIVTVLDKEGRCLFNSPSMTRLLGYGLATMAERSAFELIHPDDLPSVLSAFKEGLQHPERTVTLDFRVRHQDGSWRYLEAVGQNRLEDPGIQAIVVNSRDVTDRKHAEARLRESEEQYRLFFDDNPTPMWVFDHESLAFLEVNDAAIQHYGYSRQEFMRMTLGDLRYDTDPALVEYLHRLVGEVADAPSSFAGVWRHRKKDGCAIDVEMKWTPVSFGGRTASLTLVRDITEQRRIQDREKALAELGHKLSCASSPSEAADIIRSVADELFSWDGFTLDLYDADTDRVRGILNVDTDAEGKRWEVPQSGPDRAPSGMARHIIEHGAELILREAPLTMPDDVHAFGDVSRPSASLALVPIRNRTKVMGILSVQSYSHHAYSRQDLAILQTLADHCGGALERIRAEQALRESEQRFRVLFEGSPDAVFVQDFQGNVLDLNPAACELHDMTRQELLGMNVRDLVPAEARERVEQSYPLLVEGRVRQLEGLSRTGQGQVVPVEVRVSKIEYAGSDAVLLHVRDITERKLSEAALRSSELLFHSTWENSVDGMRLTAQDGTVVAVNEAYCRLVEMRREELEGRLFTTPLAPSPENEEMLARFHEDFVLRRIEKRAERRLTLANGKALVLENTNSFVELRGEQSLLLSLFRDVTAQRDIEDQLRQAQKMEAIGQLAGGIAHDFNNILTVIHGHGSLLLAGGLSGFPARSAQQIVQAAERAAALTRQLLAFSRRQVMQLRQLDLNDVLSEMTQMLGRLLGENIKLQLRYSPRPALLQGDPGMMEQVLLNLAVNARDAMPGGGSLTIGIDLESLSQEQRARHPDAQPGPWLCLTVSDSGCGIPAQNLHRIFEPFFTTKSVGKGTGLGLATVYGIVKQHTGWIDVESELGKGTTFRVFLPGCTVQDAAAPPVVSSCAQGGSETILVVEDEAPVRELVCNFLSGHGYRVLQADSGTAALRLWRDTRENVDLVLTDLIMPDKLNGRELAEHLWADRPGLKVLFTSGYSAEVVGKDFVLNKDINFLQKPYPPQKLAAAVRSCLDAVN